RTSDPLLFLFRDPSPTGIYTLSLHDALPISPGVLNIVNGIGEEAGQALATSKRIAKIAFTGSTPVGQHILKCAADLLIPSTVELDRKSTRLNSSHVKISYAVFCLKKKKQQQK